jgi:tetratricopeptide (TPR) repeat protein
VAAPTLSLIENGISMPTLDTLYSLSVIYRTPMQRLYEIVGLGRMMAATDLPATLEETCARYNEALGACRWFDALTLAAHGERLVAAAGNPLEAVRWREARAICMPQVGMQHEAILLLNEVLADPRLERACQYRVLKNLASAHLMAGQFAAAAIMGERALASAPAGLPPDEALALRSGPIAALVMELESREPEDERIGRQVLRSVHEARRSAKGATRQRLLLLDVYEAAGTWAVGNRLVAGKQFQGVAREARESSERWVELAAQTHLGRLLQSQGKLREAARALATAEAVAVDLRDPTAIFDVAFRTLMLLDESETARRQQCLRRCERYYPLVQARTPSIVAFEGLAAAGSQGR